MDLEMSDYARAATSDIGENEKRSSPKTLSFDIVFARPAERYQNAITRQMQRRTNVNLTTKSSRRIVNGGIRVHVSETICLSDYRNRVLINISRRDDA